MFTNLSFPKKIVQIIQFRINIIIEKNPGIAMGYELDGRGSIPGR
jgi:hypothetical protein